MDRLLLFLFTSLVKYFCEKFFGRRIRRVLFGRVSFLVGRGLPQRRYHRNRVNFIKRVISVCVFSLLGILLYTFYYIYRHNWNFV